MFARLLQLCPQCIGPLAAVAILALALAASGCGGGPADPAVGTSTSHSPKASVPPPIVEVVDIGVGPFTKEQWSGPRWEASFGTVLRNTSPTLDALNVLVRVKLLDEDGNLLGKEASHASAIPAGKTYYCGGEIGCDATGPRPKKVTLETDVLIGETTPQQYGFLRTWHIRVKESQDGPVVTGYLTAPESEDVPKLHEIGCVLFARDGRIVGGGKGYLDHAIYNRDTQPFRLLLGVYLTPRRLIDSVRVSSSDYFGGD